MHCDAAQKYGVPDADGDADTVADGVGVAWTPRAANVTARTANAGARHTRTVCAIVASKTQACA